MSADCRFHTSRVASWYDELDECVRTSSPLRALCSDLLDGSALSGLGADARALSAIVGDMRGRAADCVRLPTSSRSLKAEDETTIVDSGRLLSCPVGVLARKYSPSPFSFSSVGVWKAWAEVVGGLKVSSVRGGRSGVFSAESSEDTLPPRRDFRRGTGKDPLPSHEGKSTVCVAGELMVDCKSGAILCKVGGEVAFDALEDAIISASCCCFFFLRRKLLERSGGWTGVNAAAISSASGVIVRGSSSGC